MMRNRFTAAERSSIRVHRGQAGPSWPAAVAHPLLHLQRFAGNGAVRRLIGSPQLPAKYHAPRFGAAPPVQRQPDADREAAAKASVEACLKQKGDLLPGGVGVVERINRDVLLNQALGTQRKTFEDQVRQEYDARQFVCEAGVPAMLALFYNRDFRNRIWVKRARENFAKDPHFYSVAGFEKVTNTRATLEKKYRIAIRPGDKDWSPEDIGLLAQALGKLTEREIPLIGGYRFVRWTNRCNQLVALNPDHACGAEDYSICGLHEPEIVRREHTITMYDCMKSDSDERPAKGFNVPEGAATIVHEIGHAMEYGRLRLALERTVDAKRQYERLQKQAAAATTADARTALNRQLEEAKRAWDEAERAEKDVLSARTLDQFRRLTKGKRALTPYSKKNDMEAFAEAYMLFKVAPGKLRTANRRLYDWFNTGGFI